MSANPLSNWSSLAFNGIIALLYGVVAIFFPGETLLTIITWFGIVILIVGIAMLFGVISNIRNKIPYTTDLIWTIITLAIGAMLTFYTQRSVEIFVYIIGAWSVLIGGIQLYMWSQLPKDNPNRNTILINGIIMIVLGVILFMYAFIAAKVFWILTGVLAAIVGLILIVLAMKMKGISKELGG